MASADETVTLEIEVRAKDLSKAVMKAMGTNAQAASRKSVSAFGRMAKAAVRASRSVGRLAAGIGRKLLGAVKSVLGPLAILAGTGGLLAAIKSASDFRKKMAEVSTLITDTSVSMETMREETLSLAQALGVHELELAEGLYEGLSRSVIKADDAMRGLTVAAKLGIGGVTTTSEAVQTLATVMAAYGDAAASTQRVSDILFKTVQRGGITMSGLSSNIGKVSAFAAGLQVPLEEVAAMIATLTTATGQVAESFTGIQAIMRSFVKVTPEIRKAFRDLGIDVSSSAIASGGIVKIMEQLSKQTDLTKEGLIALFPELEAFNAVMVLSGDNIKLLIKNLEGMKAAAGSSAEAFLKIFQEPAERISRTLNSIRVEFTRMGNAILLGIDQAITNAGGIEVLTGNFRILAEVVGDLARQGVEQLGNLAGGIGAMVKKAGGPAAVSKLLKTGFEAFFGLMKGGLIGIKDAVLGLVEALKLLPAALQQVFSIIPGIDHPGFDALKALSEVTFTSGEGSAAAKKNLATLKDLWEQLKAAVNGYVETAEKAELKEVAKAAVLVGSSLVSGFKIPLPTEEDVKPTKTFFELIGEGAEQMTLLTLSFADFTRNIGAQLSFGTFESFRGFFRDIISGAKSAEEAMRAFGQNIALMLADLIAQIIAFRIASSIFTGSSLFGFGSGGIFPAAAQGAVVARAATGFVTGPGILPTGAGPVEVGDNPERREVILPLRHGPRGLGVDASGGGTSAGTSVRFEATFVSIDPRGAADVILRAMPQIEQKLAHALSTGSNNDLIRAVGGA